MAGRSGGTCRVPPSMSLVGRNNDHRRQSSAADNPICASRHLSEPDSASGQVMTTTEWFLDDEPSSRFPVYCRGNVGEIVPNVATPLSASITTEAFRLAFTRLFTEAGAFSAAELAEPSATGGVFGGYLYFNMSFARSFAAR